MTRLPIPDCLIGYPTSQVKEILGDREDAFYTWMYGQTVAICEGKRYDYASGTYRRTDCGPHGTVVYAADLERFLAGLAPVD